MTFTFTPSGGATIFGADQTFRTLPDGRVTIGDGTPAPCTDAALGNALATAKEIRFDCGALPITIEAYRPGADNTKPAVRELVARALAEFELTGEID